MLILGMEINKEIVQKIPPTELEKKVRNALKDLFRVDNPEAMLEINKKLMEPRVNAYLYKEIFNTEIPFDDLCIEDVEDELAEMSSSLLLKLKEYADIHNLGRAWVINTFANNLKTALANVE